MYDISMITGDGIGPELAESASAVMAQTLVQSLEFAAGAFTRPPTGLQDSSDSISPNMFVVTMTSNS